MKYSLPLIALCVASCSGNLSTIDDGYAYKIPKQEAKALIDSTMHAYVDSDRILPSGGLEASGYSRSLTDTQTYTISAIPVPTLKAYGFEVRHRGTMFNGPSTAEKIYKTVKRRADLLGTRVQINK